jgi:hypothetical protein
MVYINVFREDGMKMNRRMSPGIKLEAAFLTPQRKHSNTPVKLIRQAIQAGLALPRVRWPDTLLSYQGR